MTLREVIKNLQDFADKNPEALDLDAVIFNDRDRDGDRHYTVIDEVELEFSLFDKEWTYSTNHFKKEEAISVHIGYA